MQITYTPITHKILGYDIDGGRKVFVFNQSVTYFITDGLEERKVTIEKGSRSDGVTIKSRVLQFIFGCCHSPKKLPAAFLHDYMCENKDKYSRKYATRCFYQLLTDRGVSKIKAWWMCLGVEIYQITEGWR